MRFLLVAGGLLVAACTRPSSPVPPGFARRQVAYQFDDRFRHLRGYVQLLVPTRYDTLQAWTDESDAQATRKYRFTSSAGCLFQESGWVHTTFCDQDLDQLTMEVDLLGGAQGPDTLNAYLAQHQQGVEQMARALQELGGALPVWRINQRMRFRQRLFTVQAFYGSRLLGARPNERDKLAPFEQLIAATVFKYRKDYWRVTFRCECKQADCRGFADQAQTVLSSIEMTTEEDLSQKKWWH